MTRSQPKAPGASGAKPDRRSFEEVIASHRGRLLAHCYRFTGSLHEAEDLVQETTLKAWRAIDRFEGRSSLLGWLYRIATNVCLTAHRRQARARRVLPDDLAGPAAGMPTNGPCPADIPWLEPVPDVLIEHLADPAPGPAARHEQRDTVHLAFIAAVQLLPARQRAVLLLCDVLGWTAGEAAATLGASAAAVNSALQRARGTLAKVRALEDIGTGPDAVAQRRIARRYVDAWERTDVPALVALLARDATLVMPPFGEWYRGRAAIRGFIRWFYDWKWNQGIRGAFRLLPTRANGQLAFGGYTRLQPGAKLQARSLHVLSFRGEKIQRLTIFIGARFFAGTGLPLELE